MLASTGIKGLLAYRALRKMNKPSANTTQNKENFVASSTLSKATTPPSVVAITGSAYALSKMTHAPKVQRFLLKSTLTASVAGLLNAGLKRLIGRERP